ncbi:kinase D-interacting substrate of 220 kDa-like [Penaeus japonicus]|uniref:kinase D-interacting substrate of 220 kDa-like n=1 Tax=Penaeus japonicus TaxID=27405 RepID=UPI001C70C4E0|nr:kinase D-interacting substrate of 220 kDa-like [Penaeus japonicus]
MGVHDRWPLVLMTLMATMYLGCDFQASAQCENIFSIDLLFVMLSERRIHLHYGGIPVEEQKLADTTATIAAMGVHDRWPLVLMTVMAMMYLGCDFQASAQTQNLQNILQGLQQNIGNTTSIENTNPENIPAIISLFRNLITSLARQKGTEEEVRQVAAQVLNHPAMQQFIAAAGLVDLQNLNGSSLLLSTASGGILPSVRLLLAAGAYVNLRDNNGWTPLIWAARNNHSDVVKVLLEAGADPNIENWNYGDDALGWAAYNGNPTIVQDLLNAGAEVDHRNKDGNTAFLLAVKHNHLDIARILFNHGAYINAQNNEGRNAVIQAAEKNNLDMLRFTIQSGGSLNAKTTKQGDTALMLATSRGYLEVMRELLASGVEVDLANLDGYTALSMSITQNQPEAARILLAFGADINQRAKDGDSVLMEAVNLGRQEMVEVLLQHCPDMSVENINRKTVFTLARQRFNFDIKDMINAHESTTCLADGRSYNLGSVRYDSCRQQQCCNSIWRNTGVALESCGDRCRTLGTASGTCVLVNECVRLEQVFLVTNAAGDVGRTTKFLLDHRCDTRAGGIHVCCPTA